MILLVSCKTDSYTSMFSYPLFVQGDFYFLPWQINQETTTLSNMFYFSNHQTGNAKTPRFKRLTAEEREELEQMKTSRFDNKE